MSPTVQYLRTNRYLLFFVLILVSVLAVFPQVGKGSIEGQIIDANGAMIPGANVTLMAVGDAEKKVAQSITDSEGRFSFSSLVPASYELRVKVAWFGRVAVRKVRIIGSESERSLVTIPLEACSDEEARTSNKRLSDVDRAEIARILVDRVIKGSNTHRIGGKFLFVRDNLVSGWLTSEQTREISILGRSAIQEITEAQGGLPYYSLTAPVQLGGCVTVSVVTHITVKGQIEDANMAGGSDTFEFRKIDGKWVPLLLYSVIS